MVRLRLTHDQQVTIVRMRDTAAWIAMDGAATSNIALAQLKARCEEFLAHPLIQALDLSPD